jgi:hypothetical protein
VIRRAAAIAVLLPACTVCLHGPNWPFKTGMDRMAGEVSLDPVPTTIDELIAIPHADRPKDGSRIAPAELRTYTLRDVVLSSFQRSPDGDVHMVLTDEHGHTLIAESTPPSCTDDRSPWKEQIASVRASVEDLVGPALFGWGPWYVSMSGVGYMDFLHAQPGVASNGMEIHPILAICFGKACPLPDVTRPPAVSRASARCASP